MYLYEDNLIIVTSPEEKFNSLLEQMVYNRYNHYKDYLTQKNRTDKINLTFYKENLLEKINKNVKA